MTVYNFAYCEKLHPDRYHHEQGNYMEETTPLVYIIVKANEPIFWRENNSLGDYTAHVQPNSSVINPGNWRLEWLNEWNKSSQQFAFILELRRLITSYCFFTTRQANVVVEDITSLLTRLNLDEVNNLHQWYHYLSLPHGISGASQIRISGRQIPHFNIYIISASTFEGHLPLYIPYRGLTASYQTRLLLHNIFLCFFSHVPSNEPCSCVAFRVSIWTMTNITAVGNGIYDNNLQVVPPSWTSRQYYIRLSLNLDIMIANAIFCTYQLIEELHSRVGEVNSEYENFDVNGNEGHPITMMSFSVYRDIQNNNIKGRHKLNSLCLLQSWRTHECFQVRMNYLRCFEYLTENKKKIFTPQSILNCIATCYLVGMDNVQPVSIKDKKLICKRACRLLDDYKHPLNRNIRSVARYLKRKHPEIGLTIRNFRLEVIYEYEPSPKTLKKKRKRIHKGKKIEIWIAAGHAYAIIDGECNLKPPIEYFNIMDLKENVYKKEIIPKFIDKGQKQTIYAAFDIETTAGFKDLHGVFEMENSVTIHPYIIGFAFFDGEYQTFKGLDCVNNFVDFLMLLPGRRYQIYAHNGGNFDFLFVLREFFNRNNIDVSSCLEIDGTLVSVTIHIKHLKENNKVSYRTSIVFRDSCPVFSRQGLESLCLTFAPNIPKLVGSVNHDHITTENFMENMESIDKYLVNDVTGLIACLQNANKLFLDKFGFSIYNCYTSSSISRKYYLGTEYNPELYPLYKLPIELDSILRQGYYGGRCECFQLGEIQGPIYYYDVTSEYPTMMTKFMPYGFPKYIKFGKDANWTGQNGVFHAKVKGKSDWGPNILPWRGDNGFFFPEFSDWSDGWWWSEELDTAQINGYEVQWIEGFTFEVDNYFFNGVMFLFELKKIARKEGNKALENLAKVMINSLYGFWATRVQDISKLVMVTTNSWDPSIYYIETQSLLNQTKINNTHILRVKETLDVPYSYSPISIACTSLARLYIWKIMADIEKNGGLVYYCDTDSVICNFKIEGSCLEERYMKNKGADLGELKNEFGWGNSVEKVCLIGPKIYGFSDPKLPKEFQQPKLKGFYKRFLYERSEEMIAKVIHFHLPVNKEFATEQHTSIMYRDLLLMNQGWKVLLSTWRFRSKVRAYFDDFEIRKEKINVTFAKNYVKGVVDELDKIHPFKIKN